MNKNADNRNLRIVRTGLALPTEMRIEGDGKVHFHGDKPVKHGSIDPHIWLGMDEAGYMVDAISQALIDRDAKNADIYKKRTVELKQKLAALLRAILSSGSSSSSLA